MIKRLSKLDYFTLKVLICLYEMKCGSKVADKLETSQPKVSRALSTLREIFDNELFIREKYGLTPNAFATVLYPKVKAILAEYDELGSVLNTSEPQQILNFSAQDHFTDLIVTSVAQVATKLNRTLSVNISPWNENIKQQAIQGMLDYSITMSPISHDRAEVNPIFEMKKIYLVGRVGHPIFSESLTLEKILSYKQVLVCNSLSGMKEHWLERRSKVHGLDFQISFKTMSLITAIEQIAKSDELCWAASVIAYENIQHRQDVETVNVTELFINSFEKPKDSELQYHLQSFINDSELTNNLIEVMREKIIDMQNKH